MLVGGSVLESSPAAPEFPEAAFAPELALPAGLRRCRRLVVATVRLPEFLAGAAGLALRLAAAGVLPDVLVAAYGEERADAEDDVALAKLGIPTLRRYRLALPAWFGEDREEDLVAALSELIGFDPGPGVYCLVPVGTDAGRLALRRAARRLAGVYRMRVIGYLRAPGAATINLTLNAEEWSRKSAALSACSPASPVPAVLPVAAPQEHFVPV